MLEVKAKVVMKGGVCRWLRLEHIKGQSGIELGHIALGCQKIVAGDD